MNRLCMSHHLKYLDHIIPKAANKAAIPTRSPVRVICMSWPAATFDRTTLLLVEGAELAWVPEVEALAGLDGGAGEAEELTGTREVERGIVVVITVVEFAGQLDIDGAQYVSVISVVV